MNAKLHFISGMPRSGTTLLAGILRQNPAFHAAMSGPVAPMVQALLGTFAPQSETAIFVDTDARRGVLRAVVDAYHAPHADKAVVFDTNRAWCARLPVIRELYPEAKVIACVRDVAWIIDSFERLALKLAAAAGGGADGPPGAIHERHRPAEQQIGETRLQMIDLENQRAEEVAGELRDVGRTIAELREQVRAAEDILRRRDILAPVDGSVVNLATVTPGGVVGPGAALMEIVPEDDRLTVEARLRPSDIDEVHQGLPAEVRLTAFKAWATPTLEGEVAYVSADRLTDPNTGEAYYDLRIEVEDDEAERLDDVMLYPGMPVQTTIALGDRPFLEYLVQPVLDSLSRAFREQ